MPAQTKPAHPNRRSFLRTLMLAGAVPFVPSPALSLAAPRSPGEGFDASRIKDHMKGYECYEEEVPSNFCGFHLITAKVLPEGANDILAFRPLGITCAVAAGIGGDQPPLFVW